MDNKVEDIVEDIVEENIENNGDEEYVDNFYISLTKEEIENANKSPRLSFIKNNNKKDDDEYQYDDDSFAEEKV